MCENAERPLSLGGISRGATNRIIILIAAVLCCLTVARSLRGQDARYRLPTVAAALEPESFGPPVPPAAPQTAGTTAAPSQVDPNDPMAPHDPGIYYTHQNDGARHMVALEPVPLAVAASSTKWTATIRGGQAQVRIREARPTFYFYLPPNQIGFPGVPNGGTSGVSVMSPREFVLAHLEGKNNEREVPIEKARISTGRGKRGSTPPSRPSDVRSKDQVAFSYDKVAPGIYKIQPQAALEAGEYGFLYSGSLQMPEGRLFDFGVDGAK